MWHITSTKIIDNKLEAIKIASERSCISVGERVEIVDFNGKIYKLIKPVKNQLTTDKKETKCI
jgi:hypothetical protein